MSRPSQLLARLETWLAGKLGRRLARAGGRIKAYLPLVIVGWYFYGMFVNAIRLGIASTFSTSGEPPGSIWVANPIKNLLAVFSPQGLAITAVCVLLFCLITKKGYIWFSGYKYVKDPRGFDILPDATHGSSGFMTTKEMEPVLNLESLNNTGGTLIGKLKDDPLDGDKYAKYASLKESSGLDSHSIIFGSTGSGKSRGYVRPFIFQAVKRRESIIVVDPKAELYESTADYMRAEAGYTVKVFNLLDPEHSDGWNCLNDIEWDKNLVDAVAEVIIKNTSNVSERQDFWEKAEKNLLTALMHYVQSQTIPGTKNLLPIEQRSLGAIYRLLSDESFAELERRFDDLPKNHPAKAPYGIFKLAHRQIWGNIAIGLGNRLSVFQNPLLDQITAHNDIDMTLPGKQPCIYYCVISAQDSQYEFLSSLFFSCIITRLIDFARREGVNGRLPVTVNLLFEELCNIGNLGVDFLKQLAILRGFNIHCQMLAQSIPQLSNRYPKEQWEEIISHCDCMICLGANDLKTATYFSDKCGRVTIRVDNNQMPLMPLFSPVYHSTRPYSQTRSNTQRLLMMPDEILRMDNKKGLVLLRGQKPLILDKIVPEEFPVHEKLTYTRIVDYLPAWRQEAAAFEPMPEPAMPEPEAPTEKPRQPRFLAIRQAEQDDGFKQMTLDDLSLERPAENNQAPAWYPRVDYAIADTEDDLSAVPEDAAEAAAVMPANKYGALTPLEVTPRAVRDKGVSQQNTIKGE